MLENTYITLALSPQRIQCFRSTTEPLRRSAAQIGPRLHQTGQGAPFRYRLRKKMVVEDTETWKRKKSSLSPSEAQRKLGYQPRSVTPGEYRDDLVVVLAGYKDKMDRFFQSNPGMRSRVAHPIDFPDYQSDELMAIANLMLGQLTYRFSADAQKAFAEYLGLRVKLPHFSNARSVRNALVRIRLRQASRLFEQRTRSLTREGLITIEEDDIRASRVFEDQGKPDDEH